MRGNVHVRFGGRVRRNGARVNGPPRSAPTLHVPASKVGAELLLDVSSTACERTSLLVTTNLPFENWVEVLGSERLTGATLDRLTHRCHILECNGESYRLADAKRRRTRAGP
jgi:hypothetical protein